MPSATASGADATPNGTAKSREHNQGSQDRKFTAEQKIAVIRVRKCAPTAFYEILGVEKTVTDSEIKKAYRKLSLLTHPDKNGYEGADEAFKMVSRAFQILSDPEKKSKYDKFGGDPDNRFGPGAASASSSFSGFASPRGGGRGPMYEDEISPEELFNRFFGGGMGAGGFGPFGGGGGMFDGGGPQFVFNMGGGPGFRVHQFGGGRPRRRPREANDTEEPQQSTTSMLTNLLPLLILFVLPLLTSLFSSAASEPAGPTFRFGSPQPPHTLHRTTPRFKVDYYLNPNEVADYTNRKFTQLDQKAEVNYVSTLQYECEIETMQQNRMMQDAQGWLFQDVEKMNQARNLDMRSCRRLDQLRQPRRY
ncbi:MAG: hypothetical protein MMC33_007525 [Icmadophila ericetorum]|nr:hypothetical protein [Icmadophila ericetorum]